MVVGCFIHLRLLFLCHFSLFHGAKYTLHTHHTIRWRLHANHGSPAQLISFKHEIFYVPEKILCFSKERQTLKEKRKKIKISEQYHVTWTCSVSWSTWCVFLIVFCRLFVIHFYIKKIIIDERVFVLRKIVNIYVEKSKKLKTTKYINVNVFLCRKR